LIYTNKNMVFLKSRGLINDSISDMLTRIRNATLAQKSSVNIPFTKLNLELVKILEKEGFIQRFNLSLRDRDFPFAVKSALPPLDSPPLRDSQGEGGVEASQTKARDSGKQVQDLSSNDIVIRLKYNSKKLYKGKTKESCITNLRRISKPGLRIYANYREIPRILNGTGIVIISTPSGVMTDREARARKLGGELLCSVW
jgi:small subunit ribosomal protein S8